MVDGVTFLYLAFMFVALYMFSFFIILTYRNRKELFSFPKPKKDYFVSVIIPAYNEENNIEETVRHVFELDYPKDKLEIIVVNDGSSDNTAKIVRRLIKKYEGVTLIDKENSGKADSLNVAIEQAKGELVAVVDSDSFPDKESLHKLTGFFNDPQMGAVTSFVKVRNKDENFFAKIQSIEYLILGWSRKLLDFVESVFVTNGPLSLYRKTYIDNVGGFDTKTVTEDIDITWNMLNHGYKTGMCLDSHVSTVAPTGYKAWFRQRTRWGLGGLQAIVKYRRMFFRRGMFGVFILPYVAFSVLLSIATFLFSTYLISRLLLIRSLSVSYSLVSDAPILTLQEINLYPSVIIFYFIVLFTLSISYSWYIIRVTNYEKLKAMKKFFNLLFYVLVYLTLYPLVWFSAFYRYAKRDYSW